MTAYLKREIIHTAFAIGVTVLVAVAADLAKIESFDIVTLSGLAITATRSLGTAIVFALSRYVLK